MSKALREQKCLRPSTACAGQTRWPVQRRTTSASPVFSSISRSAAEPQTGQTNSPCRESEGFGPRLRALFVQNLDDLRDHVAGALHHHRVADPHVLAGDLVLVVQGGVQTTTPPTVTGRSLATGVSAPVRPTWISIASRTVVARSAGNLCAVAQRGLRETKPRRCCSASSSTL